MCDQIVDILVETKNQPSHITQHSLHDRQPILKRLSNKYFESGICAVLEEINSMSPSTLKKSKIVHSVLSKNHFNEICSL